MVAATAISAGREAGGSRLAAEGDDALRDGGGGGGVVCVCCRRQLEVGLQFLVGFTQEDLLYVDHFGLVAWNYLSHPLRFWCAPGAGSHTRCKVRVRLSP